MKSANVYLQFILNIFITNPSEKQRFCIYFMLGWNQAHTVKQHKG